MCILVYIKLGCIDARSCSTVTCVPRCERVGVVWRGSACVSVCVWRMDRLGWVKGGFAWSVKDGVRDVKE